MAMSCQDVGVPNRRSVSRSPAASGRQFAWNATEADVSNVAPASNGDRVASSRRSLHGAHVDESQEADAALAQRRRQHGSVYHMHSLAAPMMITVTP